MGAPLFLRRDSHRSACYTCYTHDLNGCPRITLGKTVYLAGADLHELMLRMSTALQDSSVGERFGDVISPIVADATLGWKLTCEQASKDAAYRTERRMARAALAGSCRCYTCRGTKQECCRDVQEQAGEDRVFLQRLLQAQENTRVAEHLLDTVRAAVTRIEQMAADNEHAAALSQLYIDNALGELSPISQIESLGLDVELDDRAKALRSALDTVLEAGFAHTPQR